MKKICLYVFLFCGALYAATGNSSITLPPDLAGKDPSSEHLTIKWDTTVSFTYNKLLTSLSGEKVAFRIMSDSAQGSLFKVGIKDPVYCQITDPAGGTKMSKATEQSGFLGANPYYYSDFQASVSGEYTVVCFGIAEADGKLAYSDSINVYVAPAYYDIKGIVHANKDYTLELKDPVPASSKNKIHSIKGTDMAILTLSRPFSFELNGHLLQQDKKTNDTGITAVLKEEQQNNMVGYETNGICKGSQSLCAQEPVITPGNISMNSGVLQGIALDVGFEDVYQGQFVLKYSFPDIEAKIDAEKTDGKCDNGHKFCPYPPVFEYTFDYLVVPNNFKVSLNTATGENVKVFYYGQGGNTDPNVESPVNLSLQALDSADKPLKNFISGVASQDMALEMKSADDSISIALLEPNSTLNTTTNVTQVAKSEFSSTAGETSKSNGEKILSVRKQDGTLFDFSQTKEPTFGIGTPLVYFDGQKSNADYPQYTNTVYEDKDDTVFLRGRINIVDADNATNTNIMPTSTVYYEFYCMICDITKVQGITGATSYSRSPSAPGWWIDNTFSKYNFLSLQDSMIQPTSLLSVSGVSGVSNGVQTINYNTAPAGKYEVKIPQDDASLAPTSAFPIFLFYNPYYTPRTNAQDNKWGSSATVTIYENISKDDRNFGVDTDAGKNTRNQGRIGGF